MTTCWLLKRFRLAFENFCHLKHNGEVDVSLLGDEKCGSQSFWPVWNIFHVFQISCRGKVTDHLLCRRWCCLWLTSGDCIQCSCCSQFYCLRTPSPLLLVVAPSSFRNIWNVILFFRPGIPNTVDIPASQSKVTVSMQEITFQATLSLTQAPPVQPNCCEENFLF